LLQQGLNVVFKLGSSYAEVCSALSASLTALKPIKTEE
jgi:hypothetical protein